MKDKILFVIGLSKNGGAEKRAKLVADLLKDKYDTKVFAFVGKSSDDIDYSFKQTYEEYKNESFKTRIDALREVIDEVQPDVVFSFLPHINFFTTIALKKKKYKNIRHIVAIAFPFYKKLKDKFLIKHSLNKADAVYYQCSDQKKYLKSKSYSFVLPNPISLGNNEKQQIGNRFIAAGRLEPQKDYDLMIDAFAEINKRIPDATLDIFGDGTLKQHLLAKIDSLGLSSKIKMNGYTDDIAAEYDNHDCFIFTTKYEGFPNVLGEAMAHSLVCFTTYFETGCKDLIINNETGFICEERNANAFANMVCDALSDRQKALEIAKKGQNHISKLCSQSTFVDNIDREIKKLLQK